MSAITTIAKRTAAGIAAAGIAAGIALGASGTAAADSATYTRSHDIHGSVAQHCHQNRLFANADTTKTAAYYLFMATGSTNNWERVADVPTVQAGDIYCSTQLRMTEKDAGGTMHVRVSTGGIWYDWLGQHTFNKTTEFDLGANQSRTLSQSATSNGGDYNTATVTVTNTVH